MALNRAQVLSAWKGDGLSEDTAFSPSITTDYPAISKCQDITAQPSAELTPNPNVYSVLIEVDDSTLALIEADPLYIVLTSDILVEDII